MSAVPPSTSAADLTGAPLGQSSAYPEHYDPQLLFPIARSLQRQHLASNGTVPFFGADLWTAYELSWLNPKGKPQVGIAHIHIPAQSSHIIESKSFKLYLNSFNETRYPDAEALRQVLIRDLSAAVWGQGVVQESVGVTLLNPSQFDAQPIHELDGLSLDRLDIDCTDTEPAPQHLRAAFDEAVVEETLTSQLFKSNCPVTGQPDWASLQIRYAGPQIDQAGLLRYLVSYRRHQGFHEHCVERIFMDLWTRCKPLQLTVYARFTRRGGLDINPIRTSHPMRMPMNVRTARQ